MGGPSKELWGMLAICIPIVLWQTWVFSESNATNGYYIICFEAIFLGFSSYMVWRYGGIAEAVTKILEVTRVWDRPQPAIAYGGINTETAEAQQERDPSPIVNCQRCGYRMPMAAKFCRRCGAPRD
jgi:ribosomal protein L40E